MFNIQPVKSSRCNKGCYSYPREVKGKCAANIKPGDKIVMKGANISLEKSDNVCGYALSNIIGNFAVRLSADLDELELKGRLWHVSIGSSLYRGNAVLFEVLPMGKMKKSK